MSEHYLNRLNSWRRILELDTWNALVKHVPLPTPADSNPRKKLYNPKGLPSDKNPKAWTYLVRPCTTPAMQSTIDTPTIFLDPADTLKSFREMYIDSIKAQKITKDEELNILLFKMLSLDRQFKSQSSKEKIIYPIDYVKNSIKKEFKLK